VVGAAQFEAGGGRSYVFLIKLSADGQGRYLGAWGDQAQFANGLAVDGLDVVIVGQYMGAPDFGGGALPPSGANDRNAFVALFDFTSSP
jgi:hypothetical protein